MAFGNTVLFKRSSFFIDVINVIFHVDLFLFHEIRTRIEKEPDGLTAILFRDTIPNVWEKETDDIKIIHLASQKKHQNILFDWVNWEAARMQEWNITVDGKPAEVSKEEEIGMVLDSLYVEFLTNPINHEYLQMTEFGNAIRLLLGDSKIDKLVFHIPFESEILFHTITEEFSGVGSDKISVSVGTINPEVKEFSSANSYVFENVGDVDEFLKKERKNGVEVLIPTYEYNMMEDRDDLEKLVEQVTIPRLRLKENPSDYMDKYNLSINSIGVPI